MAKDIYLVTPEPPNPDYPPDLLMGYEYHEIYLEAKTGNTIFIKSVDLDPIYLEKILSTFKFIN